MLSDYEKIRADLTWFGSECIHQAMGLNDGTVRQWRKRGYLNLGDKSGRSYMYHVGDIAYLMILRELNDAGVKMAVASAAADVGAMELVSHVLISARVTEVTASPEKNMDKLIESLPAYVNGFATLFGDGKVLDFESPANYLITGGDDMCDWRLIDDLIEVDELEDFNLAVIHIDLRKLADRLVNVLERFDPTGSNPPKVSDRPQVVLSVATMDAFAIDRMPQIRRCSLAPAL